MLIQSQRLTRSDIATWNENEKADSESAKSDSLKKKWDACKSYALEFIGNGPAWAGVSWGKDSVVLAGLLMQVAPSTPLRWFRVEPICNPDCEKVRDAFLCMFPHCDYAESVIHCRVDKYGVHASGTLEEASNRVQRHLGTRRISGVRSDESSVRLLRTLRFGINTENTSAPLAHLTTSDVFALLYKYQLPVHPAYAMTGGNRWPRQHLRVASLGGKRGNGHGREEWEREYYGQELRRIEVMRA